MALPLVANVTEAGDIVLLALVFVILLIVGVALYGVDSVVGRLRGGARGRGGRNGRKPSAPTRPSG